MQLSLQLLCESRLVPWGLVLVPWHAPLQPRALLAIGIPLRPLPARSELHLLLLLLPQRPAERLLLLLLPRRAPRACLAPASRLHLASGWCGKVASEPCVWLS